jgi:hypothetical protein
MQDGSEECEMFKTANSVKTLRTYYKNRNVPPSPEYLSAELQGESDRAIVILLSALLDETLTLLIGRRLAFEATETQYDHVFRFEGPLGTFSSRIEIAYLFGFIDELTRSQLDDIREMRNACAHTKHQIDFGVTELANVAKRLFRPRGVTPLESDTRKEIRGAFVMEFTFIYHILLEGSREKGIAVVLDHVKKQQRDASEPIPSPDTPPQR